MSGRGRWISCWLCVLQTSPGWFLQKTVVHSASASAKRLLRGPWCSASSAEKSSTAIASQQQQTWSTAKPGYALFASGRENPPWTRSCLCWLHCRGFESGCQKGTHCASSSRGLCDGSTEFSRPARRECWRKCRRWSVETHFITFSWTDESLVGYWNSWSLPFMRDIDVVDALITVFFLYCFRERLDLEYLHIWLRKSTVHLSIQSISLFHSRVKALKTLHYAYFPF